MNKETMIPDALTVSKRTRTIKRLCRAAAMVGVMAAILIFPAYAADAASSAGGDPVAVIDNMNDLLFSIIKGVGVTIAIFSGVLLAISMSSHDSSQRLTGIVALIGAIIAVFLKQILQLIGIL